MSADDYFGSFENENDYEDNPDLIKRKNYYSKASIDWASRGYSKSKPSDSEYWETKNGDLILIEEMSDIHLLNAFKKCKDKRLRDEMLIRLFTKQINEWKETWELHNS